MEIIWRDRKRPFLGLPWSFTIYTLTEEKLLVKTGILRQKEEEVRLYRIMDVTLKRSLGSESSAWARSTAVRRTNRPRNLTSCTSRIPSA